MNYAIKVLVAVLCVPVSYVFADDEKKPSTNTPAQECLVKQSDLKGIVKTKSNLLKKHFGVKPNEGSVGLSESALLANKAKVIYTVGGCAHTNATLTYRNVKPTNQTTAAFVQLAIKMIKETPFEPGAREPEIFMTALKTVGESPKNLDKGQIELQCGDASCALDFREKTAITLSYDLSQ